MKPPIVCALIAGCIGMMMAFVIVAGPGMDSPVALIDGDCSAGRPLGNISDYPALLRVTGNKMGYIRVRSYANFDALAENVIGTVPCGTVLHGEGPLKDADVSAGIGYAVAVRDGKGNVCRGYVSYTVVDVLQGFGMGGNPLKSGH